MVSFVCPLCNKDDAIQKVSAVLLSGASSGSLSGPSNSYISVDGKSGSAFGYTRLSGSSSTDLAELLTPPKEPFMPKKNELEAISCSGFATFFVVGMISMIFGGVFQPLFRAIPTEPEWLSLITGIIIFTVLLVAFIALCVFMYKRLYKHFDRQEEERFMQKNQSMTQRSRNGTMLSRDGIACIIAIEMVLCLNLKLKKLVYQHHYGSFFMDWQANTCAVNG